MECLVWVYRNIYWCKRRLCPNRDPPIKIEIPNHKLPWFWIGADYGTRVETVTDIVNYNVKYGKPVDINFLEEVTGFTPNIWKYVDTQSLEEREFPSEGIVIENDQPVSNTE